VGDTTGRSHDQPHTPARQAKYCSRECQLNSLTFQLFHIQLFHISKATVAMLFIGTVTSSPRTLSPFIAVTTDRCSFCSSAMILTMSPAFTISSCLICSCSFSGGASMACRDVQPMRLLVTRMLNDFQRLSGHSSSSGRPDQTQQTGAEKPDRWRYGYSCQCHFVA
jgi:hypothetical protein